MQLSKALSDAAAALQTHHDQAEVLLFEVHVRPVAPSDPNLGYHCGG